MTDQLGYTRYVANQTAGSQELPPHPAGIFDDDSESDSEKDEQTIVVPSFPPTPLAGNHCADEPEDESHYAEDLARLQKQEHAATLEATKLGEKCAIETEALLKHSTHAISGNQDSADSSTEGIPGSADVNKSADSPVVQSPI